jgi:hypothetical protein
VEEFDVVVGEGAEDESHAGSRKICCDRERSKEANGFVESAGAVGEHAGEEIVFETGWYLGEIASKVVVTQISDIGVNIRLRECDGAGGDRDCLAGR